MPAIIERLPDGSLARIDVRTLDQAKAERVAAIKEEAGRRIVSLLPEWKQRNLTARAAELLYKAKSSWTAAEKAEWTAGQELWDQVKAIRAASDAAEAAVMAAESNQAVDAVAW